MRALQAILVAVSLACVAGAALADTPPVRLIVDAAQARGAGYMLRPGIIATNAHVVRGMRIGEIVFVRLAPDGPDAPSRLIARSATLDLALLEAPPQIERRMRASGADRPFGALAGRVIDEQTIEGIGPGLVVEGTQARPGHSGSPVFDMSGRFVGMLSAVRSISAAADVASAFEPVGRSRQETQAFVLSAAAVRAEAALLLDGPARRAPIR